MWKEKPMKPSANKKLVCQKENKAQTHLEKCFPFALVNTIETTTYKWWILQAKSEAENMKDNFEYELGYGSRIRQLRILPIYELRFASKA